MAKTKKIATKKASEKTKEKPVGKVTHYFSDIKVGVVKLSAPLQKGDHIRITGGETTDFKQTIVSMQANHQEIKKAKRGQSIGLKTKEKVRDGYKVYKI